MSSPKMGMVCRTDRLILIVPKPPFHPRFHLVHLHFLDAGGDLLFHYLALQGILQIDHHVFIAVGASVDVLGIIITVLVLTLVETASHLVELEIELGLLLETRLEVQQNLGGLGGG